MSPEDCAAASLRCHEHLLSLIAPQATVAGYVPIRKEVDVQGVMTRLGEKGHSLCLPVIEAPDKPLFFRRWKADDVLEKGRYGIAIPPAGAPVFRPGVILVPLVAFDRTGQRLGYGAGYYDRTLAGLREGGNPVLVIGVGYHAQEVELIPVSRHDQPMDMIVTDKEIIRIGK